MQHTAFVGNTQSFGVFLFLVKQKQDSINPSKGTLSFMGVGLY